MLTIMCFPQLISIHRPGVCCTTVSGVYLLDLISGSPPNAYDPYADFPLGVPPVNEICIDSLDTSVLVTVSFPHLRPLADLIYLPLGCRPTTYILSARYFFFRLGRNRVTCGPGPLAEFQVCGFSSRHRSQLIDSRKWMFPSLLYETTSGSPPAFLPPNVVMLFEVLRRLPYPLLAPLFWLPFCQLSFSSLGEPDIGPLDSNAPYAHGCCRS